MSGFSLFVILRERLRHLLKKKIREGLRVIFFCQQRANLWIFGIACSNATKEDSSLWDS